LALHSRLPCCCCCSSAPSGSSVRVQSRRNSQATDSVNNCTDQSDDIQPGHRSDPPPCSPGCKTGRKVALQRVASSGTHGCFSPNVCAKCGGHSLLKPRVCFEASQQAADRYPLPRSAATWRAASPTTEILMCCPMPSRLNGPVL
ncbi:hypothetical protein XENOCAPTIV_014448, partial [Xenoophorus captivus]